MQLANNDIHIWTASLAVTPEQEQQYAELLSADEIERAVRFVYPEHRRRFVVARSILRQILSYYTKINSKDIKFSYNEHKKPALITPAEQHLEFNLSHSHELAAYAIARQTVGIDLEKIQGHFKEGLAERFFSPDEQQSLLRLPAHERTAAFYRIWAKKEAVIKATGMGLAISLSTFSVSPANIAEKIQLQQAEWYLQPLSLDSAFAAALATLHQVEKIIYYQFPITI